MPRLPPVTTATAPCKFKTASLSVEFSSEPGECYCRSRPGANYVYKAHKHKIQDDSRAAARIGDSTSTPVAHPRLRGRNVTILGGRSLGGRSLGGRSLGGRSLGSRSLTGEHIYVNCIYICSYRKWAF